MAGLMRDGRRKFNVMTAWGTSRFQQLDGKSGLMPLLIAIKWFLKVWIARSAGLVQWSPGESSWYISCLVSM